ncbi:MAG: type II secretion system minor pseudopilin GspJ [Gammaproteobacteria bacterium]|nr:type II secretion system minor pseudopilin GspJ [Gammaproteobacteria bacterium]
MTRYARNRHSGFTLVELLVALLVFGLLASIVYASLDRLSFAALGLRERAAEFAELQRAVATLDADLRQLTSRLGRDSQGRLLPALSGTAERLLSRRAGRDNPAGLPRSQLQQFRWAIEEARLVRSAWSDAVADPADRPVGRTSYPGLRGIEFRFMDGVGRWQQEWPGALPPETLPAAIEFEVESERFGRVRRLIVL